MSITFRDLDKEEIDRIREINRGEKILESYILLEGALKLIPTNEVVENFTKSELTEIIKRQQKIIASHGRIVGALLDSKLVGITSIERNLRGMNLDYCKMDILYVDRDHRNQKIGTELVAIAKNIGREFGAKKLYVSATPTKGTVDFYMRNGATLVREIDSELYELEPNDIHLELST